MATRNRKHITAGSTVSMNVMKTMRKIAAEEKTTVSSYIKRLIATDLVNRGYPISEIKKQGIDIA